MNKYELYYQVAQSHLVEQDDRIESVRQRAIWVVGVATTLMGLAGISGGDRPLYLFPVAGAMAISWLAGTALCIGVLLPHGSWRRDPPLPDFKGHLDSGEFEDEGMAAWVGNAISASYDANEPLIRAAGKKLIDAMMFLILETSSLAAIIIVTRL